MKTINQLLVGGALLALAGTRLGAQSVPFDSGSDGSYGAMNITANTTLDLPTNGIFHCTTINIASGATLRFNRNALNTPVYLLATGDVTINGTIDVSGSHGGLTYPGAGGPGGFDGGNPGSALNAPSAGHGPGAGKPPGGNAGNYNSQPGAYDGSAYGSPLLVPLVGGSGGGGNVGVGGGGGGGAILIASNTRIDLSGTLNAIGFTRFNNGGSGGGIRLVSPIVAGAGILNVIGGFQDGYAGGTASPGRIRIDGFSRSPSFTYYGSSASGGAFMSVFPPSLPRLDIVEAADTPIPLGNPNPVTVQLPFGSDTNRTVKLRAENFNSSVPVQVVLTPEQGDRIVYSTTINNLASNPATNVVNIVVPANLVVKINAWTQ